jgi:hypothetical protein
VNTIDLAEQEIEALEQKVQELQREVLVKNQLLGLVLAVTGPVEVTHEIIAQGLGGKIISLEEDGMSHTMVFSLVDDEDAE